MLRLQELSRAMRQHLEAELPGTTFTVSSTYVERKDKSRKLRVDVEWVNGPPVDYVKKTSLAFLETTAEGEWQVVCLRWYTPAWAKSMAEYHGAHVKISTCGYNNAALLHPPTNDEDGEAALRQFRATLDYCMAPQEAGRTKWHPN